MKHPMQTYMQEMAAVMDGSHTGTVELEHFDAKYVNVYRNNSAAAHIDVLRANYKSVAALVGEDFFKALSLEYVKQHPARHRTLVGYGEHFAKMLEDNIERHNLPYLSSFTKLDRAWTLGHTARDAKPLQMDVLENIIQQGGDLEGFELTLMPSVALVRNDWPVFALWAEFREGDEVTEAVALNEQAENVLVWRHGHDVMYRDLNSGEFAFLNAVKSGGNLGLATVKALEANTSTDIGQLLAGMVGAEIFMSGGVDG